MGAPFVSRRSLSLFYLGLRIIKKQVTFSINLLFEAIQQCLSSLEWVMNPFLIKMESLSLGDKL